jgi:hypothetical protein
MSNTYTNNIALATPAYNDPGWDVPLRSNNSLLDGQQALGALGVAFTEQPSASLNVKVAAGTFRNSAGNLVSYVGTAPVAMAPNTTNYLYLTDAGVLTVNTTGFPASAFHVRVATVVTGSSTITQINDARVPWSSGGNALSTIYLALAGGTFTDASGVVTVGCGTAHGTKFGAGTTDLLAFYGAAPVAQQANSIDLGIVLSTLGLRASGGNPPLNLGTGTITCGAINIQGLTTISDGDNFALGSTTGTQIGTSASQKLAFFGTAPAVQQTGGAATASSSYTATEQGMLQKAYSALRTFGLLS